MAKSECFLLISCFSCVLLMCLSSISAATDEDRKVYVVYMGALPSHGDYMPLSHHMNILQEVVRSSSTEDYLVRSYKRSFNGFAARLTESERERLASLKGVVSVFPSKKLKLQTTGSWDFMGLRENKIKRVSKLENNIIVGVIDSGIWPESSSFDDEGFGPPPKKWKGACEGGKNFTCNNKLIGARYYLTETAGRAGSVRDYIGHGTHTASTAAGNRVKGVSFYGLAKGTARGGVPSARIAAYKVCDTNECSSDGLLHAFDDAIADGVDVITISVGGDNASPFEKDPVAIGAFHAMERGILTVNSAGNHGPESSSVSSIAPWMLTVAASTTDRMFISKVVLGDGKTLVGRSINSFDQNGAKYPLVYGEAASTACDGASARFCLQGCLDSNLVKGKIVLCDFAKGYTEAHRAGAVGAILKRTRDLDVSLVLPIPASSLTADDYESVLSYMNSTKNPKASVLKSEVIKNQNAPVVASFSSRGPNTIIDDILKPDITAPGVEILAAFSPVSSPSSSELDARRVKYSVLSGTSMSCPHVAGIAAYLKTFHPHWSPPMIQSALMTTAWPMNASVNADAEFAYGSGHVDPIRAVHPGLVYEATKADYIAFLCGLNYTGAYLRLISGDDSSICTEEMYKMLPRNLNYPSMTTKVPEQEPFKVSFHRTVTNVGLPNSTYKAKVVANAGMKLSVKVVPNVLSLKSVYEKKSFTVTVSGKGLGTGRIGSASLVWSDGPHIVRSPIVIYA